MKSYMGVEMKRRSIEKVSIDSSQIQSGDTFYILRLNGLEPMMAYGLGTQSGHVAVAVWREGQLFVCESQPSGDFWD